VLAKGEVATGGGSEGSNAASPAPVSPAIANLTMADKHTPRTRTPRILVFVFTRMILLFSVTAPSMLAVPIVVGAIRLATRGRHIRTELKYHDSNA
jgi:hypothetical protein